MKQFFGAFFGSIIGIIIATIVAVLIIVGVVKSSFNETFKKEDKETVAKSNTILKLVLNGAIVDREKEDPLAELKGLAPMSNNEEKMGLNILLKKIENAKADEKVKGIYLYCKDVDGGFASIEELRNVLLDFKKSGKFIYAYSEAYGNKEYYLASTANKIFLNPQGAMEWKGLSMSLLFFKGAFDKLGLDVQVFRHGKFKSAIEPFILDKMSDANRLQSETFLNSIWNSMLTGISDSRKITKDGLNELANNLKINFPEDAIKANLVDVAAYEDEVLAELKKKTGVAEKDKLSFISIDKYNFKPKTTVTAKADKIAVIYAEGSIESGEGDDEKIGSDKIAATIKEARLDDKIKAIVLRVNSPGGSALASDVIWREMTLAKKAKPTIVSMGNLAASGGYYISCAADRIFAQPNTITGSIGVFGMIPNMQKALQDKLGITVDTVNTNKHSDVGSTLRAVSKEEYNYIQTSVEKVYDIFTKRVAEGRKITQANVDSIGQGRVWSGADALKINLVDELGGLNDAIAYAAKKANVKDYKLVELPKQTNPFDKWLGKVEKDAEARIMERNLGFTYTFFKQLQDVIKLKGVQARLPFEMLID
ncbi:MAG: signal peptide peptidase SppA [Bacteroidota bacterium]|nr:signal peptide peptidase SppA [Bacteroidota bacterium]